MKLKRIIASILSILMLINSINIDKVFAEESSQNTGTTYYVSSLNGNNNNSGTSQDKPWQSLDKINALNLKAGDKVLLERGSIFTNQYLHIKGSGDVNNPIKIEAYGDTTKNKPLIQTNGEGVWYQDYGRPLDNTAHQYKGYVSSSILLYDVEHIEIRDIAMTNEDLTIDNRKTHLKKMDRTGVAVVAKDKGTIDHIVLENLTIKNVYGNIINKHMNNGGIYFTVFHPKNEAETGIPKFNDIIIRKNHVENVDRWGIAIAYSIYWAKFQDAKIPDEVSLKYGMTNVLIEENYLKDIGGDAITTMYAHKPLIQRNISENAAMHINDKYFENNGQHKVAAAIWPWKCKDSVFQYNEAFDTAYNQDSQAWDADSGDGTIYQYNYSHNNGGGSVMFCLGQSINNIFRYNISFEDLAGLNPAGNPDAHLYNNTFIMKENVPFIRKNMAGGNMKLENNIIYYNSTTKRTENWYLDGNQSKYVYNNNLYYNYTNTPAGDSKAITEDPKFQGTFDNVPKKAKNTVHLVASDFNSFKIAKDSPAVNKGILFDTHPNKDFFGNTIGLKPDLGAFETDADEDTTLEVKSGAYKVVAENINNVPYGTSVSEFIANISYTKNANVKLTKDDKELKDNDIITEGAKLVLSLGEQTKTYTLNIEAENLNIISSPYRVETGNIYDIPKNTTVASFLNEITTNKGITKEVYRDTTKLETNEIVKENDKLKLTGVSGKTAEYVLHIAKTYKYYELSSLKATAGSEYPNYPGEGLASYAIDGDMNTIWHTHWNGTAKENVWIQLDLGSEKDIAVFDYYPRQGGGNNGKIEKYKLEISTDGTNWTEIAKGDWTTDSNVKSVKFDTKKARYIKLKAEKSFGGFGSAAELRVGYEVLEAENE